MELYAYLMKGLGLTKEQAEGAAGALLQLAQQRLTQSEFQVVADAIPAVSDVIGKAPRFVVPPRKRLRAKLSRLVGGLGELAPLAEPLGRLRIEKELIPRCAGVLQEYFAEEKREEVAVLLGNSWK